MFWALTGSNFNSFLQLTKKADPVPSASDGSPSGTPSPSHLDQLLESYPSFQAQTISSFNRLHLLLVLMSVCLQLPINSFIHSSNLMTHHWTAGSLMAGTTLV